MPMITVEFVYDLLKHLEARGAHIELRDGLLDFNADNTDISRWEFMPVYYMAKLAGLRTGSLEPYEVTIGTKKSDPILGAPQAGTFTNRDKD